MLVCASDNIGQLRVKLRSTILQKYPVLVWIGPLILVLSALGAQVALRDLMAGKAFILLFPAISLGCLLGHRASNFVALVVATLGAGGLFLGHESVAQLIFSLSTFFLSGLILIYFSDQLVKEMDERASSQQAVDRSRHAIDVERRNFNNLFEETRELVCILRGPEHVFEFVNESHIKVLGFDATGMTVRHAQPESVEVHGILDNVFRTGKTAHLHEIPVTVGQRLRHFNLTYAARTSDTGEIDGVMILGTEVSDQVEIREKLLESQNKYQLLFDYSPLPKWIMDVETLSFLDVNLAAVRLYGYSKEEFLSLRATDIRLPEDVPEFMEAMKEDYKFEADRAPKRFRHRKKDGTFLQVEVSALDLTLNRRNVRIAAIVDVTERVLSDERQKELMASLQVAKEEAERANDLKSAFLANMSHEIRTPLGAMLGFAELLSESEISSLERSNYIEILLRNGEQLSFIINDI